MAAASRRTTTHVISRPMACREAARHLKTKGPGNDIKMLPHKKAWNY